MFIFPLKVMGLSMVVVTPTIFLKANPKLPVMLVLLPCGQMIPGRVRFFLYPTKEFQPWMEDSGYNDAVQASFYKVLPVTEDVEVQKKCNNFDYYNDKDIEVRIEYDLKLEKGLKLVQYQFEFIYKTDYDWVHKSP
jgi:hypothetical protein